MYLQLGCSFISPSHPSSKPQVIILKASNSLQEKDQNTFEPEILRVKKHKNTSWKLLFIDSSLTSFDKELLNGSSIGKEIDLLTKFCNTNTYWLAFWSSFCFCKLVSTYLSTLLSGTHSSQLKKMTEKKQTIIPDRGRIALYTTGF